MSYVSKTLNGVEDYTDGTDGNTEVCVPVRLLKDLEKARIDLYAMMENLGYDDNDIVMKLEHISYPMYMLTHKKFPVVLE